MSTYSLTEIFPNIDESVIRYVYMETEGNLERSINLILEMIKKSDISNYQKNQLPIKTTITNQNTNEKKDDENTNQNDEIIAKTLNDEILARTIQDIIMFDYINNNEKNETSSSKQQKKEVFKNKKNQNKGFSI